jgi:transcriptional antiterminator NusG
MPKIPAAQDQWYVIHVLSGQELKVRDNIERRRESEEMSDLIFEALVPQERISEVKGGQKREANRKFYQETDGIINFAGTKGNPMPMPKHEVESMLAQIKEREGSVKPAITHEVGDAVVVSDGPFQGQAGVIAEINEAKGELMVSVNIFGRETLVPLEYWQVELG